MNRLRTANMLGALAVAVAERLEAKLKSHPNQTDSAASALQIIAMFEGCSNDALSKALKLSHPATVRLVDKLEAAGLVDSRVGSDRRSVALVLTPAGKERARAVLAERCVVLTDIIDILSPEQQAQLSGIAETMLRALTTSPVEAAHICRLCDEANCPHDLCPVHREALRLVSSAAS